VQLLAMLAVTPVNPDEPMHVNREEGPVPEHIEQRRHRLLKLFPKFKATWRRNCLAWILRRRKRGRMRIHLGVEKKGRLKKILWRSGVLKAIPLPCALQRLVL
jgi:hypothetical protein